MSKQQPNERSGRPGTSPKVRRGEIWVVEASRTATVWHVKVVPDRKNKLAKISSVDTLQLRGIDTQRFIQRLGEVSTAVMRQIVAAIAAVVEYEPELKGGD